MRTGRRRQPGPGSRRPRNYTTGTFPIKTGQRLRIQRYPRTLELIHNPELNYWKMLARKMHWAARPRRGTRLL